MTWSWSGKSVNRVRISIRSMSETTSSGGFPRSPLYWSSWLYASLRSAPFFLYSQPKNPFFQASANPCLPPSFLTRRSVVNVNPLGSTAPGLGCLRTSQRSKKCSCEADRSVRVERCHFSTKAGRVHVPAAQQRKCDRTGASILERLTLDGADDTSPTCPARDDRQNPRGRVELDGYRRCPEAAQPKARTAFSLSESRRFPKERGAADSVPLRSLGDATLAEKSMPPAR